MIPVTVHGAEGRMGKLVTELVTAASDLQLVALVTEPGRGRPAGEFHPDLPLTPQDELAQVQPPRGVIVDFSLAPALSGLLAGAAATGAALVSGTTGFTPEQRQEIADHARNHPVVFAANFSLGIPALKLVLQLLARTLPGSFQAEEVETHHRHKLDRPSGTAQWLADAWGAVRGGEVVPIHSLRVGGVVGEHAWTVSDDHETVQVLHRAHSRQAFLRGVKPAIRYVARQQSGLFGLEDVLAANLGS
ncbi:MAG: dihydrodipicolinate reductase C-terminal domain-containing protein [bacterium]